MFRMMSPVGDPVLVGQWRRGVNREFFGLRVVHSGCLHLDRVVSKAEFGQTEATNVIQGVDALEKSGMVPIRSQLQDSAAEKVELDLKRCKIKSIVSQITF